MGKSEVRLRHCCKSKRNGQYLGKFSQFHEFPLLHTRSVRVLNPRKEEQTGDKLPS